MKSVGEVMAIGRTFQESLQKALRGLETGIDGLDADHRRCRSSRRRRATRCARSCACRAPNRLLLRRRRVPRRLVARRGAARARASIPGSSRRSRISCARRQAVAAQGLRGARRERAARAQAQGLLRQPPRARCIGVDEAGDPRARVTRWASARCTSASTPARPSSRRSTAYLYSTYEEECEAAADRRSARS